MIEIMSGSEIIQKIHEVAFEEQTLSQSDFTSSIDII